MKSRDGKSQRREEKKKEDQKRESLRRKKIQVREKVGKSRNTVFFQWCVAPEGRKASSLKRRVRSQLARWETKNCTLLWREAHFQVKLYKTLQPRSTFGSWCWKNARRGGAKHIAKSKVLKMDVSEHFLRSASPIGFLFLKLLPPPCAALLAWSVFLPCVCCLNQPRVVPWVATLSRTVWASGALPWRSTGDVSRGGSGGQGLF